MKKFLKNNIYLILVLVLSIPAVWALFHKGFYGASDDLHIAWLFEMDKILKLGQIPPRFVPDLSFGFGYPLFNFVFPLPFYLGEIFHLLNFSLVDSVKIIFGISLVASALTMYFFLKELISKELALAGSLIYLYTPYRSTDVYIRGAIGEALSFVFLPLVLFGIIKISKGENRYLTALSFGVAGLILSHNIVSYMFFPFAFLLVLILWFFRKEKTFLRNSFLAVGLGLLISSYFWLPAILDSRLMTYSTVFNFIDHFPTLKQLVTPYFGYGASVSGPYDGMSFFIGLVNLAIVFFGTTLGIFYWKKMAIIEKSVLVWGSIVFAISIFMMNFRSSFLWRHLPFLPYFQFPWRFLTMTTLVSVIFLTPFKYIGFKYSKYIVGVLLALGVVILNFNFFKPHDFLEREDAYYLNRYIPAPVASSDYTKTQEEYLRLPKDTKMRPDKNYPIVFADTKFSYSVETTNEIYTKVSVSTPTETMINYNKYYFPGWLATIDGVGAQIKIRKPFGQIAVNIPKGQHILQFDFKETRRNSVLDLTSGVGLLVTVYFGLRKVKI